MFPTTCAKTAPLSGPARAGDRHKYLLEVHLLVASLQGQLVFPFWELAPQAIWAESQSITGWWSDVAYRGSRVLVVGVEVKWLKDKMIRGNRPDV